MKYVAYLDLRKIYVHSFDPDFGVVSFCLERRFAFRFDTRALADKAARRISFFDTSIVVIPEDVVLNAC